MCEIKNCTRPPEWVTDDEWLLCTKHAKRLTLIDDIAYGATLGVFFGAGIAAFS